MKKKILLSFLVFFVAILAACTKQASNENFLVTGVNGVNETINKDEKSISFSVDASVDSFNTDDIILNDNISLKVYSDSNRTIEASNPLSLKFGLNEFYLTLYVKKENSLTENWDLLITREDYVEEKLEEIVVKELKNTYKLNEEFTNGILLLKYTSGKTEEIILTLDMVSEFDTSSLGKKELVINYEGFTIRYEYIVSDKVLNSISLFDDVKTVYEYAEELLELDVIASYEDGEVSVVKGIVTGYDSKKIGKQTINISYGDKTITLEIEVISGVVEILVNTFKNSYTLNESFNPGKLNVSYSDGRVLTIDLTIDMVSGFDTSTAGNKKMIISYGGLSITYNYSVGKKAIALMNLKQKDHFMLGSDTPTLYVIAKYEDGSEEIVEANVEYFDSSIKGVHTLFLSYQELTIQKYVTITDKVISVTTNIDDIYYLGEIRDSLNIIVKYANNVEEQISLRFRETKFVDTSSLGEKETEITYEGITFVYKYKVVKDEIGKIELTHNNIIKYGSENIKIRFTVYTTSYYPYFIELSPLNFDPYKLGKQNLEFNYLDQKISHEFTIYNYITSIEVKELKTEYVYGEEFANGILTLHYANNESKDITLTKDMVRGFDDTTLGNRTLTICYDDFKVEYSVNFISNSNEIIDLYISDLVRTYYLNKPFSYGKLGLRFSDNHTEEIYITEDMISGFDTSSTGWKTITIKYLDKILTEKILVINETYDDFILPEKSDIDSLVLKDVLKKVYLKITGKNEESFNYWWKYNGTTLVEIINKTGISNDRFNNLVDLFNEYFEYLIDISYSGDYQISDDDINKIKELINGILDNVKTEEIGIFLVEMMLENYNGTNLDLSFIFHIRGKVYKFLNVDSLKKLIDNNLLETINNFFNNLVKPTNLDENILFNDYCLIVDSIRTVLQAVININSSLLTELIYNINNYSESAQNIKYLMSSFTKVMRKIVISNDVFTAFSNISDVILRNHYLISNDKNEVRMILSVIDTLLVNSDFYLSFLDDLSVDIINDILNIKNIDLEQNSFSVNLSGTRGYYHLAKLFLKVYTNLFNTSLLCSELVETYIINKIGRYNYLQIIDRMYMLNELNLDTINLKNNKDILNSKIYELGSYFVATITDSITYLKVEALPILINTNLDVARNAIKNYLKNFDINLYDHELNALVLELNTLGMKNIYIPRYGISLNYLVFSEEEANVYIKFNNDEFKFIKKDSLNEENLKYEVLNKNYLIKIKFIDKILAYDLNFSDILFDANVYYKDDYGIQLITIEYITSLGVFYDFMYIGVYDYNFDCRVIIEDSLLYYCEIGTINPSFNFTYYSAFNSMVNGSFSLNVDEEYYLDINDGDFFESYLTYNKNPFTQEKISIGVKIIFYKDKTNKNVDHIDFENLYLNYKNPQKSFNEDNINLTLYLHDNTKVSLNNLEELKNYLLENTKFSEIRTEFNILNTTNKFIVNEKYGAIFNLYGHKLDENTNEEVEVLITSVNCEFKASGFDYINKSATFSFEDFELHYKINDFNEVTNNLIFKLLAPHVIFARNNIGASYNMIYDIQTVKILLHYAINYGYKPYVLVPTGHGLILKIDNKPYIYFYLEEFKDEVANYNVDLIKHVFSDSLELTINSFKELLTNYYHFVITKFSGEKVILKGEDAIKYFDENLIEYTVSDWAFYLRYRVDYFTVILEMPVLSSGYYHLRSTVNKKLSEADFSFENVINTIKNNNIIFYDYSERYIIDLTKTDKDILVSKVNITKGENLDLVELELKINDITLSCTINVDLEN